MQDSTNSLSPIETQTLEDCYIRSALNEAVHETLERDWDLVALGGHEQAIAHRIAVYLEPRFPGLHVDCEYNRRKNDVKHRFPESPAISRQMRPDIIVHRRNTMTNTLAVELKCDARRASSDDLEKLTCLMANNAYSYQTAAFVCIHNSRSDIESCILRATISWFTSADHQLVELAGERQCIELTAKRELISALTRQH